MAINEKKSGDCGYIALFDGKRAELYAPNLYQAKLRATDHFRPSKHKVYQLSVTLAEDRDGKPVVHVPDF